MVDNESDEVKEELVVVKVLGMKQVQMDLEHKLYVVLVEVLLYTEIKRRKIKIEND
jgi:hypothetical protein